MISCIPSQEALKAATKAVSTAKVAISMSLGEKITVETVVCFVCFAPKSVDFAEATLGSEALHCRGSEDVGEESLHEEN